MGKIIRLTEADLTRLVSKVIKEQSKVMIDKVSSSSSKEYNMIDTCASMGVKTPGYCDTQGKKPVKSCASLGVKTPGFCYVDTKKPIPNQAPKGKDSIKEQMAAKPQVVASPNVKRLIDDVKNNRLTTSDLNTALNMLKNPTPLPVNQQKKVDVMKQKQITQSSGSTKPTPGGGSAKPTPATAAKQQIATGVQKGQQFITAQNQRMNQARQAGTVR
jgi:hypothetical protein